MVILSTNIKYLRKQQGLTQLDLADELKLCRASIGAYEENRAEPKLQTLIDIANFFSISLDDLVLKDIKKENEPLVKVKKTKENERIAQMESEIAQIKEMLSQKMKP